MQNKFSLILILTFFPVLFFSCGGNGSGFNIKDIFTPSDTTKTVEKKCMCPIDDITEVSTVFGEEKASDFYKKYSNIDLDVNAEFIGKITRPGKGSAEGNLTLKNQVKYHLYDKIKRYNGSNNFQGGGYDCPIFTFLAEQKATCALYVFYCDNSQFEKNEANLLSFRQWVRDRGYMQDDCPIDKDIPEEESEDNTDNNTDDNQTSDVPSTSSQKLTFLLNIDNQKLYNSISNKVKLKKSFKEDPDYKIEVGYSGDIKQVKNSELHKYNGGHLVLKINNSICKKFTNLKLEETPSFGNRQDDIQKEINSKIQEHVNSNLALIVDAINECLS